MDMCCLWREGGVSPSATSCRGSSRVGGSLQKGQDMAAVYVTMYSSCLQKVHVTCPGISSPDCDGEQSNFI